MIRNKWLHLVNSIEDDSSNHMTMELQGKGNPKVMSIYAPATTAERAHRDKVYEELDRKLSTHNQCQPLYIFGDFNARLFARVEEVAELIGNWVFGKGNNIWQH